jgi:uncharacterized protein (TIGR04255 family)
LQSPLVWQDWFHFSLPIPEHKNSTLENFQMHFEQNLPENCKLIVNCLSIPPLTPQISSVILDLDIVWQGEPVGLKELANLLERVHAPHRLAFEGYISDKLRESFS